jgi:hypothetical protein
MRRFKSLFAAIGADGKLVIRMNSRGMLDQYAWLCAVELRS